MQKLNSKAKKLLCLCSSLISILLMSCRGRENFKLTEDNLDTGSYLVRLSVKDTDNTDTDIDTFEISDTVVKLLTKPEEDNINDNDFTSCIKNPTDEALIEWLKLPKQFRKKFSTEGWKIIIAEDGEYEHLSDKPAEIVNGLSVIAEKTLYVEKGEEREAFTHEIAHAIDSMMSSDKDKLYTMSAEYDDIYDADIETFKDQEAGYYKANKQEFFAEVFSQYFQYKNGTARKTLSLIKSWLSEN